MANNATKSVRFISASAGVLFSATQSSIEFSSDSQEISIVMGPDFRSRLQQEDGFFLLKEDGFALLKERE